VGFGAAVDQQNFHTFPPDIVIYCAAYATASIPYSAPGRKQKSRTPVQLPGSDQKSAIKNHHWGSM
ncbi:MAG: hypothetical protein IIX10_01280, partial [Clostridia bacterium]|nr:hypothetical protein [Clostridia bacterium]